MPPDIPGAKRAGLRVDFARLAAEGDSWLAPEDRYALKTYGVCAQEQDHVFMIRAGSCHCCPQCGTTSGCS